MPRQAALREIAEDAADVTDTIHCVKGRQFVGGHRSADHILRLVNELDVANPANRRGNVGNRVGVGTPTPPLSRSVWAIGWCLRRRSREALTPPKSIRNQYGGLKSSAAKRLKDLEEENHRLKQAVAELTLDKQIAVGDQRRPRPRGTDRAV
jgi:hypothetical protein